MNIKNIEERFKSPKFQRRRMIKIVGKNLTFEDITFMVEKMNIKQLRRIRLERISFGSKALQALAKGDWSSLKGLRIHRCDAVKGQWKKLAQLHAEKLTRIILTENNLLLQDFNAIIQAKGNNLSRIHYQKRILPDQQTHTNYICVYLRYTSRKLSYLNLGYNQITQIGVKYLIKHPWNNLKIVNLNCNRLGDQGCKWLSHAEWKSLSSLSLQDTQISKTGCKWISKANFNVLTHINLNNNKIGWQGCKNLADSSWLKMNRLQIRRADIPDEGLRYLIKCNWQRLTRVDMKSNNFESIKQIRSLQKRFFPNVPYLHLRFT